MTILQEQTNPFLLLADPAMVLAAAERLDRATAARTRRGGFWARSPLIEGAPAAGWNGADADEETAAVFELVGADLREVPPHSPLARQALQR